MMKMKSKLVSYVSLACMGLIFSSALAIGQSNCAEPPVPQPLPENFSLGDLQAGIQAARNFMNASKDYQDCIAREVSAAQAAATADKPFDVSIRNRGVTMIDANQRTKEKVATDINDAIDLYKKSHPS